MAFLFSGRCSWLDVQKREKLVEFDGPISPVSISMNA